MTTSTTTTLLTAERHRRAQRLLDASEEQRAAACHEHDAALMLDAIAAHYRAGELVAADGHPDTGGRAEASPAAAAPMASDSGRQGPLTLPSSRAEKFSD